MGEVKSKEESKVPVMVTNVSPTKHRYSEYVEYRMKKFSRVSRAKKLAFQWKEPEIRCENSIKEILDSKGDGDIVRLKAKVLQKSETTSVYSRVMKKDLSKCNVVVADLIGAIIITLWEENKVSVNNSYCIYEMVVNSFNKKHLNSNKGSSIITCDDLVVPEEVKNITEHMATNEKSCETMAGRILAVSIKRLYTCVNFKCKMADNGKTVFKCSKCELAIRKADMSSCITSSVVIED